VARVFGSLLSKLTILNIDEPRLLISTESEVISLDKEKIGRIYFSKDGRKPLEKWLDTSARISVGGLLIWITLLVLVRIGTTKVMRPLGRLSSNIKTEGERVGIKFESSGQSGEIEDIQSWFESLAKAWLVAQEELLERERKLSTVRMTQAELAVFNITNK